MDRCGNIQFFTEGKRISKYKFITPKKSFFPQIIFLLIFIGLIYFFYIPVLDKTGRFLVYEKPIAKADAMIVLSGCAGERIEKAVELYKDGYASKIVMAGGGQYFGRYFSEYMKDYAIKLGAPKKAILEERNALSTLENAVFLIPLIKEKKWQNILLVTSKYHTRRSYKIFERVLNHDARLNVNIYIIGADDKINYSAWWKTHEDADKILTEWAKVIIYMFQYRIL